MTAIDRFEELLDAWAANRLAPDELREFESILAANPELREEAEDHRRMIELIRSAPAVKAPAGLMAAVLREVRADAPASVVEVASLPASKQSSGSPSSSGTRWAWGIAAAVLVIGGGYAAFQSSDTKKDKAVGNEIAMTAKADPTVAQESRDEKKLSSAATEKPGLPKEAGSPPAAAAMQADAFGGNASTAGDEPVLARTDMGDFRKEAEVASAIADKHEEAVAAEPQHLADAATVAPAVVAPPASEVDHHAASATLLALDTDGDAAANGTEEKTKPRLAMSNRAGSALSAPADEASPSAATAFAAPAATASDRSADDVGEAKQLARATEPTVRRALPGAPAPRYETGTKSTWTYEDADAKVPAAVAAAVPASAPIPTDAYRLLQDEARASGGVELASLREPQRERAISTVGITRYEEPLRVSRRAFAVEFADQEAADEFLRKLEASRTAKDAVASTADESRNRTAAEPRKNGIPGMASGFAAAAPAPTRQQQPAAAGQNRTGSGAPINLGDYVTQVQKDPTTGKVTLILRVRTANKVAPAATASPNGTPRH